MGGGVSARPRPGAVFAGTHLANVVRADCGDGLERQLLAADAHEGLFHLTQEILSCVCRQKEKIYYSCESNLKSHQVIQACLWVCGAAAATSPDLTPSAALAPYHVIL